MKNLNSARIPVFRAQGRNIYDPVAEEVSTISGWALVLYRMLAGKGIAVEELFANHQIYFPSISDNEKRFPTQTITRILDKAASSSGDGAIGLSVVPYVHPAMFHGLSVSFCTSPSLYESFSLFTKYSAVICSIAEGKLTEEREHYKFVWQRAELNSPIAMDAIAAALVTMCRSAVGESFAPSGLRLMHDNSEDRATYHDLFRAPIEFNADEYAMLIPKELMHASLPTSNTFLANCNEKAVSEYLSRVKKSGIVTRVSNLLFEQLRYSSVSEKTIAQTLNLSPRTLQRRLQEKGTSFQQLLDNCRKQHALDYVAQQYLSVSQIGYMLGFSEQGSFSRAFRRWTGMSPSQFRRKIEKPDQ